jgi:hypothetical protein
MCDAFKLDQEHQDQIKEMKSKRPHTVSS